MTDELERHLLDPDGSFISRLASDRAAILAQWNAGERADWVLVERLAHGLAGAGALFGFAAVSDTAIVVEDRLIESHEATRRSDPALGRAIADLLKALEEALASKR